MRHQLQFIVEVSTLVKAKQPVEPLTMLVKAKIAAKARAGYPCLRTNVMPKAVTSSASILGPINTIGIVAIVDIPTSVNRPE
jgi:hypothetical protein